jgi:hypothetical protein
VRIFVMRANQRRDEHKRPPARAMRVKYFFHSLGRANNFY